MPAPSKRDKQSVKKFEQNRSVRTRLRTLSKNFYRAIDAGETERAREIRDESQKAFDQVATKRILHSNKASRKIGRFDKALAKTSAEG